MPPSARRARPQARRPRHRQTTLNFAPVARGASSSLDPRGAARALLHSSPARAPSPPPQSPQPPQPPPPQPLRCSNIEVVIFTPPKNPPAARTLPLGAASPSATKRAASIHHDSSDGEESDVVLTSARKRRRSWEQGVAAEAGIQGDDQDEDVVTPEASRRRRSRIIQSDSEDSSDGLPDDEPPSTRRRRLNRPQPPSSIGEDGDGDEDLLVSSVARSARKLQPPASKPGMLLELGIGSDEDSDTDMLLTRQETNEREADGEEKNDSDMDDDIELASKTPILNSRLRSAPKLTPYQLSLRRLQAKRKGRNSPQPPSPSSPGESPHSSDIEEPSVGYEYNYDSDESTLSFIVDDTPSQSLLGAPDPVANIPIEFTSLSHQPPSTNFVLYARHMCLSYLVPELVSVEHPDGIVSMAIQRLESMVSTYGSSILQSSVWRPEVLRALKAYPEEESTALKHSEARCEVCNRDRHARWVVRFCGNRYNKRTLADLDDEGDEDAADNTDSASVDSSGLSIPESGTSWVAGSHCAMRLKMSHAFYHWKKHLHDLVRNELELRGYIDAKGNLTRKTQERLAGAEGEEHYKRAERIADEMDDEFLACYTQFKQALNNAEKNMGMQRSGKWRWDGGLR